jgi:DNA-binding IclR family transcriptional regulator/sugar lactone lactonase YvrE
MDKPSPSGAQLLTKALDVLEAISVPGGLPHAELAARLRISRTTLYRILAVLVERGFVRQDPSRRVYATGFRLLEMAQGALSAPDLSTAAAPELRALRDATGETAYVAVLEGREVVSLGKFEGAHEVRSAARLGDRKPLHCTSQGKAILAFLPPQRRDEILTRPSLPALTARTITTRRQLLTALELVRARGFAVDDEEILEGIRCVGAPVLDVSGTVLGAISIAGPAWRMTLERLEVLGAEVAAAGRRIGAQLRPPPQSGAVGVRVLPGPPAFLGLGPCPAPDGSIWWADALAPKLRCIGPDGAPRHAIPWPSPIRALLLTADGVFVADANNVGTWVGRNGATIAAKPVPGLGTFTALAVDPDGAAWAAAPAEPESFSAIGPVNAYGMARRVWELPGRVQSLAWSPDGGALYAAAPDRFTIHELVPARRAPLILSRLPAGSGRPAALACDAAGRVWAGLQDGWSVARLGPEGEIEHVLPLPTPRPTGIAFGGPDRRTLFVTTGRDGVALDVLASSPFSGCLLAGDAGTEGAPTPELRAL